MTNRKNSVLVDEVFTTCIDLPGESVQCWNPHAKKIKIILRKHRDVIVDIKSFKGMRYEIWATDSSIYCAKEKKLYHKGQKISMLDGEKIHLWIGRDFKGAINVCAAGRLLGRYLPEELDTIKYDGAPATKPLPFIISIQNFQEENSKSTGSQELQRSYKIGDRKWFIPLPADKEYSGAESGKKEVVHVFEMDPNKPEMPNVVANFIQSGGEQLSIDAGNVMTRNWLFSQMVGIGSFYSDNEPWVKDLWGKKFIIRKVQHRTSEKYYIVFKGSAASRTIFTARRYGVGHTKVLAFTAGIGAGKTLQAVGDTAKGVFKKCGLIAVLFTVAIDIAEWLKDYGEYDAKTGLPRKDFADLLIKVGIDITKGVLTAVITSALIGTFVFIGVITGGIGLVVGSVVISLLVGYSIDFIDNQIGASGKINQSLRKAASHLKNTTPKDYGRFEMEIESATQFEFGAS